MKDGDDPNEFLLAMIIQNALHKNNDQRVEAIKSEKYMGLMTQKKANEYLKYMLRTNLLMRLNMQDMELTNKIYDAKSTQLAEKILIAPDYVYAACLMRGEGVFFGKGDFQKLVDLLKLSKNKNFKDIANKLAMVKTGRLFKKGVLPDLNDANSSGIPDDI